MFFDEASPRDPDWAGHLTHPDMLSLLLFLLFLLFLLLLLYLEVDEHVVSTQKA